MTSRPAAPESPKTDYAVALRLARETVERDDRENAGSSRILRPGLTGEYRLAKALLSADDLLEREGINHDGTRQHDAELDRILSMTDEEVRASLVAEGIDPDLAAQNTKYAINQVIQLVKLRRELSLAQTEIKGHMRVEEELKAQVARLIKERDLYAEFAGNNVVMQARIAELEKVLASVPTATANPSATWDKLNQWHLDRAALKDRA